MIDLYLSAPSLICFEGEDVSFTPEQQARFNQAVAETKHKLRAQLAKNERQLSELSESKNLSEQEREQLRESLELTQQQLRTKEENAAVEKQKLDAKHKKEVAELKKRADEAESKHRESSINFALHDAAVQGEAYNASIMVQVLRERTTVNVDGVVLVEVAGKDADGNDVVEQLSPRDAVARLRELPGFGGLFRQNVVSNQSPQPGANGRVDVRNLSVEQVKKLYNENPRALGL